MIKQKRIAVYLRVSTIDQSTSLQSREIQEYLNARGLNSIRVYEDKASGTNSNRDQFKALMADARARRIDLVIVWKLDRFARSLKDLITHLQEFSELGVEFISLRDQIDLTTSAGRLMTHIIAAFAEFEASIIKERVRAGLANAKAQGRALGRPRTVDSAMAVELRSQGLSLSQIAKRLGVSKAAVHKTLSKLAVTKSETKAENIRA